MGPFSDYGVIPEYPHPSVLFRLAERLPLTYVGAGGHVHAAVYPLIVIF